MIDNNTCSLCKNEVDIVEDIENSFKKLNRMEKCYLRFKTHN